MNELALFAGAGGGILAGQVARMANRLCSRMGTLPSKRIVRPTK
jgi:hypothetical protein